MKSLKQGHGHRVEDELETEIGPLLEATLLGLETEGSVKGHSPEPGCKTRGLRVVLIPAFTQPLFQVPLCSAPGQKKGLRDFCQNNGRGNEMKRKL